MEEESPNLMWMKRKQILKSHIQAPFGAFNNNNSCWEEKAFAEDAARILGGCIWPPRSYSCTFCKREFRSAQALGGHMNVHRRDRARLKQSLDNDFTTSKISSSSWPPTRISTQENCFQPTMSPYSLDSDPKGKVNGREHFFKGFGCNTNEYVETSLSVGQNSVFGQKLPSDDSCGDKGITYKRTKTCISSSLPVFLKPCSNDRSLVTFQSAEFLVGVKPGMEDLDLELRLGGKTQKV